MRGPQDHPQVWWFIRRIPRTQPMLILLAVIFLEQKDTKQNQQRIRHMGWHLEETRQMLPKVLSQESDIGYTQFLQQQGWNVVHQWHSLETQGTRLLLGSWSHKRPWPSACQISRFPEGKEVFCINHIICTNTLGTVSHSYQFWEWWEPSLETQGPRCQPRANHVSRSHALSCRRQQVWPCCVNSFDTPCLQAPFSAPGNRSPAQTEWRQKQLRFVEKEGRREAGSPKQHLEAMITELFPQRLAWAAAKLVPFHTALGV